MITTFNSWVKLKNKSWPSCLKHFHNCIVSKDQNLISLLNSCKQISQVSQIHSSMVKSGLDVVPFTLSKLLASCVLVDIEYAASIFKDIQSPNLFMFNTMLRGYSTSHDPKQEQAFVLFNYMRAQNVLLDQFSFVSTLKSSARLCATGFGRGIHSVVIQSGFYLFVNVKNALLQFYCVYGNIRDAHQLFDEFSQERDLV